MRRNSFTIFEHEALIVGDNYGGIIFTDEHHLALERFYREKDFPYYKLIRKGVRFCEYVGVLQVGNVMIEVLPKADKAGDQQHWRQMLIDMLKAVGTFDIHAPSSSALNLKSNSILDLYFELFLKETSELLRRGLIKQYRKVESNIPTLKGSIVFSKHLQYNIAHQERFFVRSTVYDQMHVCNQILYKTIRLLSSINSNRILDSEIGSLLLNFPEMPDITVSQQLFSRIKYTRRTQAYRSALEIAKLLLLNYHPDVTKGQNDVLALMFDMNLLWEQFVLKSLKKNNTENYTIEAQTRRVIWEKDEGSNSKIVPDIVISKDDKYVILDTKWKNISGKNPSHEDIRQMYAYGKFHKEAHTALVYPGLKTAFKEGHFLDEADPKIQKNLCGILTIKVGDDIKSWQQSLAADIFACSLF